MTRQHQVRLPGSLGLLLLFLAGPGAAAPPEAPKHPPETKPLTECLVLAPVGRHGRVPIHRDALEAQIVAGRWTRPQAGTTVPLPDGSARPWEPARADKDGWFHHPALGGGYAYLAVPSAREQVMLLEAAGHSMVYVNGQPRAGDPYGYGYVRLPILLRAGTNDLLFHVERRKLRVQLAEPRADVCLNPADVTLPDLIVGQEVASPGALVVVNASSRRWPAHASPQEVLRLQVEGDGRMLADQPIGALPPLGSRKVPFFLHGPAPANEGTRTLEVKLVHQEGSGVNGSKVRYRTLDTATLSVPVRRPGQTHKRTFVSAIDGSVQYYAVVPARREGKSDGEREVMPGLVLTLHGAAVEATGQAACYTPRPWVHVVAPTNRRPYGFDWEDWGRLDALEVLDHARQELHADPRRIYLTGHSMGGHGAWHLGVTYPDHFAAVGPSAGWVSMWSYAGARRATQPSPLEAMLQRAATPSDTLALCRNLTPEGVYILHGDQDDNVPVEQARLMRHELGGFHPDFAYHEQPGAGHWWGNPCVDWPPMFDFFARRSLPDPATLPAVDFRTASPGVSAWCHGVGIEAQIHPLQLSSVHLGYEPATRTFRGSTENVARLALDLEHVPPGKPVQVEVDGQKLGSLPWPDGERRVWLRRQAGRWSATARPSVALKGPHCYGPFKEAFRHRVRFVYGTHGTAEENAWALAKARYDAETFWYRGNGAIEVLSDEEFDPDAQKDRSVILYGNATGNVAWQRLLADSPVQVERGRVRIGTRDVVGDDLGCLFLRPRPGSGATGATIGVVGGTGVAGMRLTDRLPYFLSGVGYPDCMVLGPETLTQGTAGVRAAGFFGMDWSVAFGEFVWRE